MRTAAVIPAYNEEVTIGAVLDVVKQVEAIHEIVVVSDGSTDHTARIARKKGVKVIELQENMGKGGAMKRGVAATNAEVIVFLDADLLGLTPEHVYALLEPVLSGRVRMSIGLFDSGRVATDLAQIITPFLSGQRAVLRGLIDEIADLDISRFGVEVALTRHVRNTDCPHENVTLSGCTHRMKEEKLGFGKGLVARLKMYWEIVKNLQRG